MSVIENKNRNVVYAVVAGSYSDKFTEGYCTTRELAEKYCALKNAGGTQGWCDYRVEELDCLDDTGAQVEKMWFAYGFYFERVTKGWRVTCKQGGDGTPDYKHRPPRVLDNRLRQAGYLPAGVHVTAWVDEPDEDKAKKIAIDAFYQWRAENPDNGVIEMGGEP